MDCYHRWNWKQTWCDAELKITRYTVECGLCMKRMMVETPYDIKKRNSFLTRTGLYGTITEIE